MKFQLNSARRRAGVAMAAAASLSAAGLAAGTSYASGTASAHAATHSSTRASIGRSVKDGYVDVTEQGSAAQTKALRAASRVAQRSTTGRGAPPATTVVTDIDSSTQTVRWQGNLDGTLTGPSSDKPKKIVFDYVKAHATDLGLVADDLKTLTLSRNYEDIAGTHHLFFTQKIDGTPMSRNGLTASVDKKGRLLTLGGSPHTTGEGAKLPPTSALTITSGSEALSRTRGTVVPGSDTSADTATKVLFATAAGLRPAWETVVTSSETPATTVIDAVTGKVLQRTPLTQYENSTGRVYKFFPGSHKGGHQVRVNFTKHGWLGRHAHILSGNNSHAYSDVNDNNRSSKSEEVHPQRGQSWGYRLTPFHLKFAKKFCSNPWPCSWNPNKGFSWRKNRAQNTTQVFFFVNNWHDHLKKAPIGFTEAAGNFQVKNHSHQGKGGDPVNTQTDDGANTLRNAHGKLIGLPDGGHIDNANMSTPPDGRRPTMQMYLQHEPGTPYGFNGDPFSPTNVGDEADTVYHEYTHGLSNRLNVDVRGRSTLGGGQAGAMGEAWSDWYAMDYLVKKGLQRDRKHKVDVRLFRYDGLGVAFDRTEPIDCKVGQHAKLCNGGETGHKGGYTYADYGKVVGGPEVHSDGEIWAQTLWDLRDKLGSRKTESLVTRAMELAPYNPSFLDMRNAILVADTAVFNGANHDAIWHVFAHRGMGFTAGSRGGDDSTPGSSTAVPPSTITTGSVSGTVTDPDDNPVDGAPVTLAYQGGGPANPTTFTNAAGHYEISGVPVGTYRELTISGGGYQPTTTTAHVTSGGGTANLQTRRDWAASSGGASVAGGTGPDYNGCGRAETIDLNRATGWSVDNWDNSNGYVSRSVVIKLPHAVDVSQFAMDPSFTCGDGGSSSAGHVRIDTSTSTSETAPASDDPSWTEAASPTFTSDDVGNLVEFAPTGGDTAVKYIRLTLLSNQTPDYADNCDGGAGDYTGCAFTDVSELEVYGSATP